MAREDRPRIVSSAHLAEGEMGEVSEFEFGMIVAYNAFTRWVQRCMSAAGMPELSVLEILVLHHVNHRARDKRLSDICFLLNIEDMHTVNYALKKLVKLGAVVSEKRGKEVFYGTSDEGRGLCERYAKVRRHCLLETLPQGAEQAEGYAEAGAFLRAASGYYDQASRAAASL